MKTYNSENLLLMKHSYAVFFSCKRLRSYSSDFQEFNLWNQHVIEREIIKKL